MKRNRAAAETVSLEEAAARLGINRSTAYALAARNEFPVPLLRAGRRILVPVAALDRALGLDPPRKVGARR